MSSWNEETKTLWASGRAITLYGDEISVEHPLRGITAFTNLAPADLAAFGHAVLAAAGEPSAPAPFKVDAAFEDVQVGDRVRVTNLDGDCLEYTVGSVNSHMFLSESESVVTMEADKEYTIDILSRPEPIYPRTVPASEAHEHVGARVTVEGDGYAAAGRLIHTTNLPGGRWYVRIEVAALEREVGLSLPPTHPIALEAPADAGASVIGGK